MTRNLCWSYKRRNDGNLHDDRDRPNEKEVCKPTDGGSTVTSETSL